MDKFLLAGSGEKAQYLVHEFNDNTIRFLLYYPGHPAPELLRDAVRTLVERVDILHASFFSDSLGAHWHINNDLEDSHFFQYVETAGDPGPTAQSLALLPIAPDSKAQLLCSLVQGPDCCAVVVTISHLCVDGGDGKYLLEKLAQAYRLLQDTGTAAGLEVKNGSRAAEQVYRHFSPKELFSLLKNPFSSASSSFPFPVSRPGLRSLTHVFIPASVMTQARQNAKAAGATANDLLLASCYHAYASLPGADLSHPIGITSMMDLRRHCPGGESEGLCNLSGSLPTCLELTREIPFSDILSQVAAQTRTAKEDPLAGLYGMPLLHGAARTLPMGLLLQVAGKLYGSMSLGLTNLGNIPCAPLALGDLVPTGGLFGGPLKKKPGMQISAASFDGACSLVVVGQYTREDAALLQSMLDAMAGALAVYASPL